MKSLKAIITTLVLGSSTMAVAQPAIRDHRESFSYYDGHRDDGYRDDSYRNDMRWRRMRPVTLASNMSLSAHDRGAFVSLDSRFGAGFQRVRLDGDMNGRTFIDSVVLRFADGRTQAVSVRQVLSRRNPSITIDTYGATGMFVRGSQMRGRGTFDIVGLRR
ncbi:MAG: hypothetical protein HOV81_01395 [Kofleriaceae bacterium]|nr:hypothetical protein [Kofleriaceae bacterium]